MRFVSMGDDGWDPVVWIFFDFLGRIDLAIPENQDAITNGWFLVEHIDSGRLVLSWSRCGADRQELEFSEIGDHHPRRGSVNSSQADSGPIAPRAGSPTIPVA
jgi:hypothetical protein